MINFKAWYTLTKPRIAFMQIITVSIGYFCHSNLSALNYEFVYLISGTLFVAFSAGMFNHILEQKEDALMLRTANRPLVLKQVSWRWAVFVAVCFAWLGLYMLTLVNVYTSFVALITLVLYVVVYTPLKKVTWLNTFVGSFPGCLPILGGWLAYNPIITYELFTLILILFLWQFPHFFALSVMYEEDYKQAGFKMLSGENYAKFKVIRQSVLYFFLLIISVFLPLLSEEYGWVYFILMSYGVFLMVPKFILFVKNYDKVHAKKFFLSTVIFLPIWFLSLILDQLIEHLLA